jgi:hypothetical protein
LKLLKYLFTHEQDTEVNHPQPSLGCQHCKYNLIYKASFFVVKYTHSCNCLNKLFFCDLSTLDLATEAAKWTIIRAILARIGLFLFIHAIVIMHIRIFTKKSSPATEDDPTSIKVLNRIITNTIEQSIIFIGLYAFFLFDKSGMNGVI